MQLSEYLLFQGLSFYSLPNLCQKEKKLQFAFSEIAQY